MVLSADAEIMRWPCLPDGRSEEHTSELQSDQISYAVFCLKKKRKSCNASMNKSCKGNQEEARIRMRRVLQIITAPSLSSFFFKVPAPPRAQPFPLKASFPS